MVDRATFERYVQEALDHLYDPADLLVHPLAALLTPRGGAEPPGLALHRILRQAIGVLKPAPDAPIHSPSWRSYRYLSLRYVEMLTIGQIASELGISSRQCRRDHHDALNAVVSILWDAYQHPRSSPDDAMAERPSAMDADSRGEHLLESEVGKIGSTSATQSDLGRIVESAVATLGPLAASKNVELRVVMPISLPPVVVDRTVLRQMLLELLLDAIDRGSDGLVELTAVASVEEVRLSITVVGLGPVAVAGSSELPIGVTRLGVSRRLAQLQGVGLVVESEASRMRVSLSLRCAAAPIVLVVDDNSDVIHLFHHFLDGVFDVREATSGAQALELSRTIRPRAITLDVMMPAQDGWEVLQTLKIDPRTADIPIIVCSVLRERELALSLGASDFLAKPVSGEDLVSALQRCRLVR